jgi:hypothetical protein
MNLQVQTTYQFAATTKEFNLICRALRNELKAEEFEEAAQLCEAMQVARIKKVEQMERELRKLKTNMGLDQLQ